MIIVVLLIILSLMAIILTIITIAAVSVGGAAFVILFGDVIVCIVAIGFIIKHIITRRK